MISNDISIWIAAYFTITIMSYSYKDNILFKFAEKTFVAAVIGNAVVMGVNSLRQFGFDKIQAGNVAYVIPIVLGILLFTRYHERYYWLSRFGAAFLVGVGTGLSIRTTPKSNIVEQLITTMTPGPNLLFWALTVLTTFTVLLHFTFTTKKVHETRIAYLPKIGRYLMLAAFGAAFGNTVMTRMNLLIGRLVFLLRDWLGLMG
ncbi:MAG: hypothetical protein ACE5Z5_10245 [Candidatus Bathyarchaeia archaeon]